MPITAEERRFLRYWEEQRQGGKKVFVAIYTFGISMIIFLCAVALGLFMNLAFIKLTWLAIIGIVAVVGGFVCSLIMWQQQEKKFRRIIRREMEESN